MRRIGYLAKDPVRRIEIGALLILHKKTTKKKKNHQMLYYRKQIRSMHIGAACLRLVSPAVDSNTFEIRGFLGTIPPYFFSTKACSSKYITVKRYV